MSQKVVISLFLRMMELLPVPKFNGFDWGRVFNFSFNQKLKSITGKIILIKIGQFAKFVILSLDCNQVEGFQKPEKLQSLYGFGGLCMEFGRHSLVTTQ